MKVKCLDQEIVGFRKTLEIEHEAKTYKAELDYDERNGYDLRFYDEQGNYMEMPKWADLFDISTRSLDYSLDESSGSWDFRPATPEEMEIAV